jgi:hypothetical protein
MIEFNNQELKRPPSAGPHNQSVFENVISNA